jgi:hypothetical protein
MLGSFEFHCDTARFPDLEILQHFHSDITYVARPLHHRNYEMLESVNLEPLLNVASRAHTFVGRN